MWHQPETERKNQGWKSCSHVKMGISRGENGVPSRISTRRHTHRHRDRGVARHPSRIGEISVSARNPPLLFPRVPLAGFCSSCSSSSSCAALPPLFTPRNPRRACHARCIVVLSGAISLSVSQGHRNPWCALTCPPTSRTSRTTPQKRVHVSRHALRLLDFKNLVHPSSRKAFLFFCVHPQSARTVTSLTFLFFSLLSSLFLRSIVSLLRRWSCWLMLLSIHILLLRSSLFCFFLIFLFIFWFVSLSSLADFISFFRRFF